MDPNENIRRQRELVREILSDEPFRDSTEAGELAIELAELVQELDRWLCKGGFRPSGWDALARSQARMGGVRGD